MAERSGPRFIGLVSYGGFETDASGCHGYPRGRPEAKMHCQSDIKPGPGAKKRIGPMTAMPPLLTLMVANLEDAVALGLIDSPSRETASWCTQLVDGWPSLAVADDAAQNAHLLNKMHEARSSFDRSHRPWGAAAQRVRQVATVMSFTRFVTDYAGPIARPHALDLKRLLLKAADPDQLADAQAECVRFSALFGASGTAFAGGKRVRAKDLGLHARQPWMAPPPRASASPAAQHWRDRLGLVNLQSVATPLIDHALVRLVFECRIHSMIDRHDWKGHVVRHPEGVWLVRPTMVHGGNKRFVQSHQQDKSGKQAYRFGKTRNLASKTFAPAERESLLICGDLSELRFISVQLLDGIPGEVDGRDNSDATFVQRIFSTPKHVPAA